MTRTTEGGSASEDLGRLGAREGAGAVPEGHLRVARAARNADAHALEVHPVAARKIGEGPRDGLDGSGVGLVEQHAALDAHDVAPPTPCIPRLRTAAPRARRKLDLVSIAPGLARRDERRTSARRAPRPCHLCGRGASTTPARLARAWAGRRGRPRGQPRRRRRRGRRASRGQGDASTTSTARAWDQRSPRGQRRRGQRRPPPTPLRKTPCRGVVRHGVGAVRHALYAGSSSRASLTRHPAKERAERLAKERARGRRGRAWGPAPGRKRGRGRGSAWAPGAWAAGSAAAGTSRSRPRHSADASVIVASAGGGVLRGLDASAFARRRARLDSRPGASRRPP